MREYFRDVILRWMSVWGLFKSRLRDFHLQPKAEWSADVHGKLLLGKVLPETLTKDK
jgi:hypothetical protein